MYRAIAQDPRVELLVLFAESGPAPRFDPGFGRTLQWGDDIVSGFAHAAIPDANATSRARAAWTLRQLEHFAPDVVYVHGYALPYLRSAMRWARRRGIPVLMTTDSELLHRRPLATRIAKRVLLPGILRDVTTFLTVGDENESYFRHYGVNPARFHRTPFSIDSLFYDSFLQRREEVRTRFRSAHNIPADAIVLLTVGKLIPRKAQLDLVRALTNVLPQLRSRAVLLIAGDGPDRALLEAAAYPIGDAVRMLGFIGLDELPACYLAADLYVHCSDDDPHPLAISEAIYCGLPVLASDRIGSIGPTDDVQPGRNGAAYSCHDIGALTALLVQWINDPKKRAAASIVSRQLGEAHAATRVAAEFVQAALDAFAVARGRD
jgi:glycosyltransferase involved in cell wall biosynthesis